MMMYNSSEKLQRFFSKAARWIFPERCPVCGSIIPLNEDYCVCVRQESRKISDEYCRHCGYEAYRCVCDKANTVRLPEITAVYIYGGKIRADILNLKFANRKNLAEKLGTLMAERCAKAYSDTDFDVVTFVPMTEASYKIRTYNQSQLLADTVGEKLFVPVEQLLVKTRQTKAQHELGGIERLENVENSVSLKSGASVKGKSILICDDVKTTGATLNQCVQTLLKNGAEKVCCVCVAISDFS
ncbi:MAG: ComF family protein [Ruminococcaceae bacterium]|nr:ComF family protein [Oscillospiraceae bacterium]